MNKRQIFWAIAVLVVTATAAWLFFQPVVNLHPKTAADTTQMSNSESQRIAKVSITNRLSTIAAEPKNTSIPADIEDSYRQGLISKEQAIQEIYLERNKKSQDFYGKVVDQYGQPIQGVTVTGEVVFNTETYGGVRTEAYTTKTDNSGLFQFTGLHGASFNVRIKKAGYIMGARGEGFRGPVGAKTIPTDRAILTMWKIRGAEPLTSSGIDAKISHDGTSTVFDIATGQASSNGDLRVTLSRSPLEVRRGRDKFDWAVKVEIINGGLIEENDPYPYWAPESGYQSSFEFNVSSNSVPWQNKLEQNFYIKNAQGQYGKMQFHLFSSLTPARLHISFTVNPSGSQNLEPASFP